MLPEGPCQVLKINSKRKGDGPETSNPVPPQWRKPRFIMSGPL
jgi:hypothetical protein